MAQRASSATEYRVALHCKVSPQTYDYIDQAAPVPGNFGRKVDHLITELQKIRTKREQIESFLGEVGAGDLSSETVARTLNCSTSLVNIVRAEISRRC